MLENAHFSKGRSMPITKNQLNADTTGRQWYADTTGRQCKAGTNGRQSISYLLKAGVMKKSIPVSWISRIFICCLLLITYAVNASASEFYTNDNECIDLVSFVDEVVNCHEYDFDEGVSSYAAFVFFIHCPGTPLSVDLATTDTVFCAGEPLEINRRITFLPSDSSWVFDSIRCIMCDNGITEADFTSNEGDSTGTGMRRIIAPIDLPSDIDPYKLRIYAHTTGGQNCVDSLDFSFIVDPIPTFDYVNNH